MKYSAGGKTFATIEEAKAFAEAKFKKTGVVLGIEAKKKRKTKAEKQAEAAMSVRLSRVIFGYQIPMLSIPALYSALEAAAKAGKTDTDLIAIVAGFPGVKVSI